MMPLGGHREKEKLKEMEQHLIECGYDEIEVVEIMDRQKGINRHQSKVPPNTMAKNANSYMIHRDVDMEAMKRIFTGKDKRFINKFG